MLASLLWANGPLPAVAQTFSAAGSGAAQTAPSALPVKLRIPIQGPAATLSWLDTSVTLTSLPTVPTASLSRQDGALALPLAAKNITASQAPVFPITTQILSASNQPTLATHSTQIPSASEPFISAHPVGRAAQTAGSLLWRISSTLFPTQTDAANISLSGRLDAAFDGAAPLPNLSRATPVAVGLGELDTSQTQVSLTPTSQKQISAQPSVPSHAEDPKKQPLPVSYYLYLAGQYIYAVGQESAALITPLYAYFSQGLAFTVTSQALSILTVIPGSLMGARLVKRFGSKNVYLAGNILHGISFISVPVVHLLTGAFSPVHFLAFQAISGLIYGALRGVAEKDITPRIVGQDNMGRLKKSGALFYAAFEGAELTAALMVGLMVATLGLNFASISMAALMLTSVIPLSLMRFKQKGPISETGGGGNEKSLSKMLYLPFIFTLFAHLSLYTFLAPFLALEVFHQGALASQFIGCYTLGSLIVALMTSYLPRVTSWFSEKSWSALGVASTLAFIWGSLAFHIPVLTSGLAVILGIGLTGMQIQWRAVYQQRLSLDAQPKVFNWLNIWGIAATLVPGVLMQAGLFVGASMPVLLTIAATGITAASLGIPLAAWLWKILKAPRR